MIQKSINHKKVLNSVKKKKGNEEKSAQQTKRNGKRQMTAGFPAGSVIKNLPVNTGDMGLVPDLGRSHVPWSTKAHAPPIWSLCSGVQELQLLKPTTLQLFSATREATAVRSLRTPTRQQPLSQQLEKSPGSSKDRMQPK